MTKRETIGALAIIATFYPHTFSLADEAMVEIWHKELEHYSRADVELAVREMCREKDKFPSLKDILDRLGPAEPGATEAWAIATKYASEWGHGPRYVAGQVLEPPGLPPVIARAAEAVGGIQAIMARTLDDEPAMRAHFYRSHDEAKLKGKREDRLALAESQEQKVLHIATQRIGRPMPGGQD